MAVKTAGDAKGGDVFNQSRRHLFAMAFSCAWLFLAAASAIAQQAPAPQPSSETAQANAAVVQSLTEFLKAQAARSEEATRLERDVIRQSLSYFIWIVGVVGTVVVAGAALLGWGMKTWSRASKTDIQQEVKIQLQTRVMETIDSEIEKTQKRVISLVKQVT